MQQYFLDYKIKNEIVDFNEEQSHHISNVLRMKSGDIVKVVDSDENPYLVKVDIIDKKQTKGKIIEKLEKFESKVKIRLLACMIKGDKWDFMIQKACELGVDEIVPVFSKRCVVKINDKIDKKIKRYNKIALEACEQCKRDTLVEVCKPILIEDVINYDADLNVVAFENADYKGDTLKKVLRDDISTINVVIGPEGGFDSEEVNYLTKNNYKCISLGKRILRAETAMLSVIANINFYFE